MKSTNVIALIVSIIAVVVSVTVLFLKPTTQSPFFGSTMGDAAGYMSTTTRNSPSIYNGISLKDGNGTLQSVIFTAPAVGSMTFYDATTSDYTKRTGQIATSSLKILASFGPLPMATGTVPIKAEFINGLLLYYDGTLSTSTILWD